MKDIQAAMYVLLSGTTYNILQITPCKERVWNRCKRLSRSHESETNETTNTAQSKNDTQKAQLPLRDRASTLAVEIW